MFRSHIRLLAGRYPTALPGDPLAPGELTLCLTFDDAFFDFYHYVFPLLAELRVKALLAVPVKYIIEDTRTDAASRLRVPYDESMREDVYQKGVPFCTWKEISDMVKSGHVDVASHSYNHLDITRPGIDLDLEIARSKAVIEDRLGRKVTTFVYPFGKVDKAAHYLVQQHYKFSMRIGSALNKDWQNSNRMIYRVSADNLTDPSYPLRKKNLLKYYSKYLSNTIRGR